MQDEMYKNILGVINSATILESSELHKIYLLEFDMIDLRDSINLSNDQISELKSSEILS